MNLKHSLPHTPPLISLERIQDFVQFEPAVILLALALISWIISNTLLKQISPERKRTLHRLFKNLSIHLAIGIFFLSVYFGLDQLPYDSPSVDRLLTYLGLAGILSGAIIFVKVLRILLFEYLYLSHMKVAFPVLLVNLFTLLLSLGIAAWIAAEIFNLRLTPILATSAIFSLVLGLALQDTLGNLFAGVALQIDKPYGIGDWIEVLNNGQKLVGQVHEISWRATILIAVTEELITVPNRVMSQAEISNFSIQYRPIIRSQIFRLTFEADIKQVKDILLKVANDISEIRRTPSPVVFIFETTESWVGYKLIYYLDNYANQFRTTDKVNSMALDQFKRVGLELSGHRVVAELNSIPLSIPRNGT